MAKWIAHQKSKSTGSIYTLLSNAKNEEVIIKNRNYVKCIIDIILYVSLQGIAFRGHQEDSNSLNQGIINNNVIVNTFL